MYAKSLMLELRGRSIDVLTPLQVYSQMHCIEIWRPDQREVDMIPGKLWSPREEMIQEEREVRVM